MPAVWTSFPRSLFRRALKVYLIFSTVLFLTYFILDREKATDVHFKSKDAVESVDYVVYASQLLDKHKDIPRDKDYSMLQSEKHELMASVGHDIDLSGDSYLNDGEDEVDAKLEEDLINARRNNTKNIIKKKTPNVVWKKRIQEQAALYDHAVVKVVKDVQMAYLTALAINSTSNGTAWDKIIISGWERKKYENASLFCCFRSGNLSAVNPVENRPRWKTPQIKIMLAIQFVCENPWVGDTTVLPSRVGIGTSVTCNSVQYVDVEYAKKPPQKESIAFCGKIIYGTYPAARIVEWMEMNKIMGVSHVALFTYNVTKDAMAVLRYYEKSGYLTLKDFDFPLKSTFPRYIGQKYLVSWIDEQVTVFDCMQRFRGYKYIGLIDVDEFVIPKNPDVKDYPDMLNRLLRKYSKAAGFTFQTELFILDWGESHTNSQLLTSRYRNRTKPMWDRRKSIFLTDKVNPQSVWTHGFNGIKSYSRVHLSHKTAAVFHYRNCRRQWMTQGVCLKNAKRYTDNTMLRYLPMIEDEVLSVSKRLLK